MNKRKSKILSLVMVFALVVTTLFVGTTSTVQAATIKSGNVAVTVLKNTLYVGDSKNNKTPLTVTYNNKKVTKGIQYSTSNKNVATVNSGNIVAVKKGTATISVKYKGKTCKVKITVKNAKLTLKSTKMTLQQGKTYTLTAYANGTKVMATSVKWTSSNKNVVSVNKNGVIKGLKKGKATITAQTSYGKATCIVTIATTHTHTWVDHTATKQVPRTVHHDAVYKTVTIPAVTKTQYQCEGCGQWFDTQDERLIHAAFEPVNDNCGASSPSGVREVVITPARTEKKLVKKAYDETVYDTKKYVDYQYCSVCGQKK